MSQAAVQNTGQHPTVGQLLNDNFKAMKSVLPKHMTAERMARIVLVEVRKNPKLAEAEPSSLIGAVMVASQLGLEIGVAGLGYLIPRWNKKTRCNEVQFQIGYRGMMDLARRSGQVGSITAEVAYENDQFSFQLGTDPKITHVPTHGNRGAVTHFYAVANLISSGDRQFTVMTLNDVEQVRDKSAEGTNSSYSPWNSHFEEMGKKTAIRRLCKLLPMSAEVQRAISLDEMADAGVAQGLGAEVPVDFEVVDSVDIQSQQAKTATEDKAEALKEKLKSASGKGEHAGDQGESPDSTPNPSKDSGSLPFQDDFELMEDEALLAYLQANKRPNSKVDAKGIQNVIDQNDRVAAIELCRSFASRAR